MEHEASGFIDPRKHRASRILVALFVGTTATELVPGGGFSQVGMLVPALLGSAGEGYRVLLSLLLHGSLVHLLVNVAVLLLAGPIVEYYYGRSRMFAIFALSGVMAAVVSAALRPEEVAAAGSGGVLGLVGVLAGMIVFRRQTLSPDLERRIMILIGVGATAQLLISCSEPFINPVLHAAGLVSGFLLTLVFETEVAGALNSESPMGPIVGSLFAVTIALMWGISEKTSQGTLPDALTRADSYQLSGDLANGIGVLEQALATETRGSSAKAFTATAQNTLAWLYAELGREYDRAIELSEESNRIWAENAAFLDTLGYLYALNGRCADAENTMSRVVALDAQFTRRRDEVVRACKSGTRPYLDLPLESPAEVGSPPASSGFEA